MLVCSFASAEFAAADDPSTVAATFQNDYATIVVDSDGQILKYMDRRSDANYCQRPSPFARVRREGVSYAATEAKFAAGRLTVMFGSSGVTAVFRVSSKRRYFVVEVVSYRVFVV